MNRALVLQRSAFVAARLGIVGWIGLTALLCGLAAVLVLRPAIERRNSDLAQRIDAMNLQIARARDPKTAIALRDPVDHLVASLPQESAVPEFVASVQKRADDSAVGIDRTEYRTQAALGKAVRRYHLSIPAHVDYVHLRPWLESLLHDYPNLTLDELSVRREVDGGEELEANIALSYLVRGGN